VFLDKAGRHFVRVVQVGCKSQQHGSYMQKLEEFFFSRVIVAYVLFRS
jgi:hypothetical protein